MSRRVASSATVGPGYMNGQLLVAEVTKLGRLERSVNGRGKIMSGPACVRLPAGTLTKRE
jgi:hypothetical protein